MHLEESVEYPSKMCKYWMILQCAITVQNQHLMPMQEVASDSGGLVDGCVAHSSFMRKTI